MRRWSVWSSTCALVCGLSLSGLQASGQQTAGHDGARPTLNRPVAGDATTTLSVDARLVNVPVIVRDKKGVIIKNLTKDDFALTVDQKLQTIRYFDLDTNLPLTLGLLVDTSQSQVKVLDEERTASGAFLDTMLTPQRDKAFVIQFAHTVELLQDLTDSRPKLQQALKELDTDPAGSGSAGGRGGGAGTAFYDSVFLAADELMSKQTGRKALILLTDGNDRGSKETLTKSIEAAQRGDTIIYAIYFKGSGGGGGQQPSRGMGGRGGGFPGGHGGGYPGGGYPGGGGTAAADKRSAWTARRCWSGWPTRPEAGCLR